MVVWDSWLHPMAMHGPPSMTNMIKLKYGGGGRKVNQK